MTDRAMNGRTLPREARRLYHVLLRTVADQGSSAGSFPGVSDSQMGGNTEAFGALVNAGLIEHDAETGLVTAVLPFVAQKPFTLVLLDADERQQRYAAGVVDGFALTPLLGRRVRVYDRCETCGEQVQVLTDPGRIRRREPRSAVVVQVPSDDSRQGRFETARLACSPRHAQAALEASGHPDAVMRSIEWLSIAARERYAAVLEQHPSAPN